MNEVRSPLLSQGSPNSHSFLLFYTQQTKEKRNCLLLRIPVKLPKFYSCQTSKNRSSSEINFCWFLSTMKKQRHATLTVGLPQASRKMEITYLWRSIQWKRDIKGKPQAAIELLYLWLITLLCSTHTGNISPKTCKGLFQKKIRTPPTDGILEIPAGGGIKDPGNPGRRGG